MFNKKFITIALMSTALLVACSNGNDTTTSSSSSGEASSSLVSQETSETNRVIELAANKYQAYTETIIDATPEQVWTVWTVLTDFDNMPSWSTTFQGIAGELTDGNDVVVTYIFQGETVNYDHKLSYVANQTMSWSDPLPAFNWMTDDHHFTVEAYGDGQTKFIQTDTYTETRALEEGEINAQTVASAQVESYTEFNSQLKAEVEKRYE